MNSLVTRLREGGQDSALSWLIAGGCFVLYFFCIGTNRSVGVLFKALLNENPGISREEASWPFTLSGVAIIYAAPLTGFLSVRYRIQVIILVGVLIFALGSFPCYFYTNIIFVSVFFGLVRGTGMTLASVAIPGIINNNFEKYTATAMGIATSGLSLGALTLPLLTKYVLDKHGLQNTFLIYGLLSLCAAFGALPMVRHRNEAKRSNLDAHNSEEEGNEDHVFKKEAHQSKKNVEKDEETPLIADSSKKAVGKWSPFEWSSERKYQELSGETNKEDYKSIENVPTEEIEASESVKLVLKSRGFYLLTLNSISLSLVAGVYGLIVVDYAIDKGLAEHQGVYLITINAGTEFVGTLFLGWLCDRNFVSRRTFTIGTSLLIAFGILIFVFLTNYIAIVACVIIMGLGQGGTFVVFSALYSEYFSKGHMVMAVTLTRTITGLSMLPRAPVIGYFRDTLGSYDYVCYLLSASVFLCILSWTAEGFYKSHLTKKNSTT